jgi:hypothetical protein
LVNYRQKSALEVHFLESNFGTKVNEKYKCVSNNSHVHIRNDDRGDDWVEIG